MMLLPHLLLRKGCALLPCHQHTRQRQVEHLLATHHPCPLQVLIVGSSSCLRGFVPAVLNLSKSDNAPIHGPCEQVLQSLAPTPAVVGLCRSSDFDPPGLPAAELNLFCPLARLLIGLQTHPDCQHYTHLHADMSIRLAALLCGHILGDCLLPDWSIIICEYCITIQPNLNSPLAPNACRWYHLSHRLLACARQGTAQRGRKPLDAWDFPAASTGPYEYCDHAAAPWVSVRDIGLIPFMSTVFSASSFSFCFQFSIRVLLLPFWIVACCGRSSVSCSRACCSCCCVPIG